MAEPAPLPEHSGAAPAEGAAASDARRALGRREHALLSLVELNRKLGRSLDAHGAAESLLLNLMGQLGTSRAALWLSTGSDDGKPVLIRCHGIERPLAGALVISCWAQLLGRLRADPRPIPSAEVKGGIGRSIEMLAAQAKVELLAPLSAESELLGLVALGSPMGGRTYEPMDLQVLEASLAIAGVAIRNANLNARILESNRRLRVALDELRELDRLKSEFISNVNHELRTPLTVVLGALECLDMQSLVAPASRDLVGKAFRSAKEMLRLVEKLLTFSAAAREGLVIHLVDGDLEAFLASYYQERQPGVSAGLRELHLVPDGAPRVRYDEHRLRQVLDELVDNAVKFTPQGSNVWLGLSRHVEGERAWARISVVDDGRGIPPEKLPELFEEFVQLDGSSTREVGGLGMGLAAAKKLAEGMGGCLTAASDAGCGASFSVLLPAI